MSKTGSIDWCCLPRFDSASVFGRILDWERGGYCAITPSAPSESSREYVDGTLVLATTFRVEGGEARLTDCFTTRRGGATEPYRQLLRIIDGVRGRVSFTVEIRPRFDYGEIEPWLRRHDLRLFSAVGGNDALVISSDKALGVDAGHDLTGTVTVRAGERVRLSIVAARPEQVDGEAPLPPDAEEHDRRLDSTIEWWRRWSSKARAAGPDRDAVVRSAVVLKALMHAPTGAFVAAPTTSLPEQRAGTRNWDYRFSWIRDSQFTVRSLVELGCHDEADGFRRFVERSAAGSADALQVAYGVGGERRLTEFTLDGLEGYRQAKPVRIGNAASKQLQLDVYGELLELAWRWHQLGRSPDDDYWRFLRSLVDTAARRWTERDRGIWETRGQPRHFVHSKVMCWVALDRGVRLARECERRATTRQWAHVRDEIRRAVETKGYRRRRGTFVQAFGTDRVDAALLLLPTVEFVAFDDERMVRTVDAVRDQLGDGGLLRRNGSNPKEGAFLAASFWLAECLARQDRLDEAREVFDAAMATTNDVGLFAEEYDTAHGEPTGNFPQGLTHLSHISAAVALGE